MRCAALIAPAVALAVSTVSLPAGAQVLDFAQARQMVLGRHPGLTACIEDLRAAEAAARQASAFGNPEIELAAEDFGRNELEFAVTQPVPLGPARGAAIDIAMREVEIARFALETERIYAEAELIRRFVPVLSAREKLTLVDSLIEVSSMGTEAVRRLVDAGAAMEIDLVRAQLDRDELVLERMELERSLGRRRTRLAELWGDQGFRFGGVSGSLAGPSVIPSMQELSSAMKGHPALKLLEAEMRLARAGIDEARAGRWPELALSAGYLRNNEAGEEAVLAGVSFSLPIFDRNGAAVSARRHEAAAAEHRADLERLGRSTALSTLYSEVEGGRDRLDVLSGDLLPKAARIQVELENFYARGRIGILDVLEARRHFLEVRMRVLDLVEEQAMLGADLIELTGYPIEIVR